jgi:hypothetical protein
MQQNAPTPDAILRLRERLPEMPIVLLSKRPDPNSHVLDIQDYVVAEETVIPLFSSPEALRASARGVELGRPQFQIHRGLLVSLAKGHEVYLLDPQTEGQLRFTAAELRPAFAPLSPSSLPPSGKRAASGTVIALTVLMWLAWLAVTLAADLLGLLMFAFADSPGSGRAAQAMVGPALAWFAFTFVGGAVLLVLRRPWQIALAFVLAVSPPFMIFAGYNVLDGAGGGTGAGSAKTAGGGPSAAPAPMVRTPSGGFTPPPMKPREPIDVRQILAIEAATKPASTQPAGAAR